MLSHFSIS